MKTNMLTCPKCKTIIELKTPLDNLGNRLFVKCDNEQCLYIHEMYNFGMTYKMLHSYTNEEFKEIEKQYK